MSRLLVIAFSVLLVGCGPTDRTSKADLLNSYQIEFGPSSPTNGVTAVHARMMTIRDWDAHWLQLRAETNLIDSLIRKGFTKQTYAPFGFRDPKGRWTPDWWVLPPEEELEVYTCDDWRRGSFRSSRAVMAIHRASGMVYF